MLVTHAVEPRLVDGARVISIGSIAASRGSGSYGAAKAALTAWNVDLARRLGPRQIVANIVSPGLVVDTEFFGDAVSQQRRDRLVADTFTHRPAVPEDIAAAVAFLASPEARHITGQVLHVNGGAWLAHSQRQRMRGVGAGHWAQPPHCRGDGYGGDGRGGAGQRRGGRRR